MACYMTHDVLVCAANVFGVVPRNVARDISIILMVIHEVRINTSKAFVAATTCFPPAHMLRRSLTLTVGMQMQCVAYAIYLTPVLFMVRHHDWACTWVSWLSALRQHSKYTLSWDVANVLIACSHAVGKAHPHSQKAKLDTSAIAVANCAAHLAVGLVVPLL